MPTRTWTEEELMALPKDGCKRELVGGEIVVMNPAGQRHDNVIMKLAMRLGAHVEQGGLGWLVGPTAGLWMPSGNLRVPDLAFLARRRQPEGPALGFGRVPPELVVEVVSPSDRRHEVDVKVREYLDGGVTLVWIIDPQRRRAEVHRSGADAEAVDADGHLSGSDVIPGFSCRLADLFG